MGWDVLLSARVTQEEFGQMVGISQPAVSALMADGLLDREGTAGVWLRQYCQRLREQAAGRLGAESGGLDLVQERAALAREQRIAQALKNDIARGEYAPIGLLADVLGMASSAVVDRFDQLEGAMRKACPDLPVEAMQTVLQVIASARNQWIKSTAELVAEQLDALADADDEAADPAEPAELAGEVQP
jgi:phage terminase Nu1 subunit (DNA packaging protein)